MSKFLKIIFSGVFSLALLLNATFALAGSGPCAKVGGSCYTKQSTGVEGGKCPDGYQEIGQCTSNAGLSGKCCAQELVGPPTDENNPLLESSARTRYSSGCISNGDCQLNDMLAVGVRFTELILGLVGSLTLLMFIYGGATMLLSQGAQDKVTKGKNIITAAVVGLVIVFASYGIISYVLDKIGFTTGDSWQSTSFVDTWWVNKK